MSSLVENKYVYHNRKYVDSDDVRDIFWPHLDYINLFNTFSTVLVLDSTKKTDKYCLSLLEFVGVTYTELTFSIAFAYMMYEKEDNVTWTLERFHDVLKSRDISPKFIIIGRDNALNVVDTIFP